MPKPILITFHRDFRRAMANLSEIPIPGSEDYKEDIFATS